jgi:glyoxylase-like metal-dependent hydrolase (beta-lactamase superfamily II)
LISGDFVHHPVQCAVPGWAEVRDSNVDQARTTRRKMLDTAASTGAMFIGTHFPTLPAGHVVARGTTWWFEPDDPMVLG